MASQPIYQFYSELSDYKPKIWRRFQVTNNVTMARLGYILMTMFEMQASHLFCFDVPFNKNILKEIRDNLLYEETKKILPIDFGIKNIHFELINEFTELGEQTPYDAARTSLDDAFSTISEDGRFTFTYDYGDNWQVSITLEKIIEDKELPGKELPRVLEGASYGIIEDCGGTYGLEELAKAFKKKKGSQYEEYCEWLGIDDLDLSAFDIDDMNFRLKKIPRIYTDIYENGKYPTKQSIDLLERKYLK